MLMITVPETKETINENLEKLLALTVNINKTIANQYTK